MKRAPYCLFETTLGSCGIAWTENGDSSSLPAVAFFQLPESSEKLTQIRMERVCGAYQPAKPPAMIDVVMKRVRLHLEGKPQDFRDVPLDLEDAGSFARRVYEAARDIPAGETRTYGEIAKLLKQPAAARAVGQALGRNPIPLIIPCHRVLAAGGKAGGFSAPGGRLTKARILALEGVTLEPPSLPKLQRTFWEITRP
ncbi:MAG: methylated-DNA--[protein]-cysteine S-methyltransferase [Acidobacteriia bacterium]|nr:methylated-DNA--[protein]-cysteine S-methyltransferase [Terriglobia bacterium]